MNSPIKPTMDLQETADTLKMHPHSVEKLIRQGDLPAGKAGRAYLLLTRDVLAYAEKIVIEQTAERLSRRPTKAPSTGRKRGGSRSASASAGSCAR
ncbi:helix-turn-helix domain-containing protein [Acidovorax sp. PRC11]|uniref:helix-turn-helix domain-containing protein n=1 Tax=Acidovorax sp. PRC11 TaxID=2962592 RepID=UPI0028823C98|nr:helix-turn-helix domain-containing protein [Acidovorax sp. PRC11]MDT0138059.1 helix-turn-helix domain-containing protein [Acidovorax sp. PRC11]